MDLTQVNNIYMVTGAVIFLENSFIFIVFLSSKSLIGKYQLFIALAFSDMFSGLGTFSAGFSRYLIAQKPADIQNNTTLADCLRAPWLPLMTIGGQLPALIALITGFERIIAVHKPLFYHAKFFTKHRIMLVFGAAAFVLSDLLAATVKRLIFADVNVIVYPECYSFLTYSLAFTDFHNFIIVFARILGFM
jgi:hypothetical protein